MFLTKFNLFIVCLLVANNETLFLSYNCSPVIVVHGPGGATMHPLRALWEWYNIVHWTSLIKNQDVNTRYLGSHPPFLMVLRWPPWKKTKCLYSVISASYHLLCLHLWADQLYFTSSTPFLIYKFKHKVLTYFIKHGGHFGIQISVIFVDFKKKFPWFLQ